MGSSGCSVFSRFAQGLTLGLWIQPANKHMAKLTDYYRIHRHAQHDLEIQIVDRSQANLVRSMQSLSGGESFLVSLALGPSESAGREGGIDLIFIDEGSGSLGSVSLKVALRALENLQAHHKTIGVISHQPIQRTSHSFDSS